MQTILEPHIRRRLLTVIVRRMIIQQVNTSFTLGSLLFRLISSAKGVVIKPRNHPKTTSAILVTGKRYHDLGSRNTQSKVRMMYRLPLRARTMIRGLFLLLFSASLLACGDSTEPTPTATGAWTGSASGVTLTVTISESASGTLSGSGNFTGPFGSAAVNITGTHAHPSISFTMTSTGFTDVNFSGSFTGDNTIQGSLNGSGFNSFALTLLRST